MGIWDWMSGRKGVREKVQSGGQPSLEQLEPRLLLNADFTGIGPILDYDVPSGEQAIFVDLNQEEQGLQGTLSPVIVFDLAGADDTSLTETEQSGPSDDSFESQTSDKSLPILGELVEEETGPVETGLAATSVFLGTPLGQVEYSSEVEAELADSAIP